MEKLKYRKVIKSLILSPIDSEFGKIQFIQNLECNNNSFNISFRFLDRLTNSRGLFQNLKDYLRNYFLIQKEYERIDIVHIVCFFSKIRLLLDLLFIVSFRKKVIYDFRGDFLINLKNSGKFIRWIYLLNVRLSAGVICQNRASYLVLKRINKNVLQIFNWIEIPELLKGTCEKKYDIVFHGRITFDKGYGVFEQLARNNPSWKILLVGSISPQIKEFLPQNIDHVPVIFDKSVLYRRLLEGRVYLFPSLREGMAFSMVEAMSLGLPVVASDICSNRFLLRGNKRCLIKPRNYEEYQRILDALLGDANLMAQIGEDNQQFMRLKLPKEAYFESLYQFYCSVQ